MIYKLNGKVVSREEFMKGNKGFDFGSGKFNTVATTAWPLVSDAMAVLPEQIGEAMALDRQLGVQADFTKEGQPIFRSRGHRKEYCQAHGFFDRNGGYGDPQRR